MANSKREPEQGPQSITNNEQEPDLDSQKTTRKKRGPAPGSQRAKHGGQAVRKKYGPEFYSRIGKMGISSLCSRPMRARREFGVWARPEERWRDSSSLDADNIPGKNNIAWTHTAK